MSLCQANQCEKACLQIFRQLIIYFLFAQGLKFREQWVTGILNSHVSPGQDHTYECNFLNPRNMMEIHKAPFNSVQFSHSLSHVQLFTTPWIPASQASLSITNSRSLLKLMSIESVMTSSHLILCRPLLLLPSIFPSIRVFSNESALCIRWPKCWSFSFSISPSNEYSGLISFRMDWLDL